MIDFAQRYGISLALVGGLFMMPMSAMSVDPEPEAVAQPAPSSRMPPPALTQMLRALQRIELQQLVLRQKVDEFLARQQMTRPASGRNVTEFAGILAELERMEDEQAGVRQMLEAMDTPQREMQRQAESATEPANEFMLDELLRESAMGDEEARSDTSLEPVISEATLQTREDVATLTEAQLATGSGLYEQGREAFTNLNFYAAVRAFRRFLQEYPTHPTAMEARYWLGETLYAEGKFDEAIKAFSEVVQDESSPYQFRALLKTGFAWFDLGDYDQAEATLLEVRERQPEGQLARQAKLRLDRLYEVRPKTDAE